MIGRHSIKGSSTLQSLVALSVGEAEYYAATKGAGFGLSMQALLKDWGFDLDLVLLSDSSVARSISSRLGAGRVKHMQTPFLWLQDAIQWKHLTIEAIPTKKNLSDMFTKVVSKMQMEMHLKSAGIVF